MGYSRDGSLLPSSYADVRAILMPSSFQRPLVNGTYAWVDGFCDCHFQGLEDAMVSEVNPSFQPRICSRTLMG